MTKIIIYDYFATEPMLYFAKCHYFYFKHCILSFLIFDILIAFSVFFCIFALRYKKVQYGKETNKRKGNRGSVMGISQ